jgi:hypothetical protein
VRLSPLELYLSKSIPYNVNLNQRLYGIPFNRNSPLRDKDTIKTYPESDALIKLNDGTEIQVDENTMIYLDFTGNSPKH